MKAPLTRTLVLKKDGIGAFVMRSTLIRDRFISLTFYGDNGAEVDMSDIPEESLTELFASNDPVEVVQTYRAAMRGET